MTYRPATEELEEYETHHANTPTTETVRNWYAEIDEGMTYYQEPVTLEVREQAFDRWLVEEIRKAKHSAVQELMDELELLPCWGTDERGDFDFGDPDHDCNRPLARPHVIDAMRQKAYEMTNPYTEES